MRHARFALALAAAAGAMFVAACSAPSLSRMYTADKSDVVMEPGIVGTWRESDRTYVVTAESDKSYRVEVTWKDKPERGATLEVHLVRLDGSLFADITPGEKEREELAERFGLCVLPVHVIARVVPGDGVLHVEQADNDALRKQLTAARAPFAMIDGETPVLTGTPEQVKAAIAAAAASPEVFKNRVTLTRAGAK